MTAPRTVEVRSGPVEFLELLRCGLVVALTNFTPPPGEILTRWRRTSIYAIPFVLITSLLAWSGTPIYLAPLIAWLALVASLTAASAWLDHRHRQHLQVWRAWRGAAGAVAVVEWSPSRKRYEAHSWAAFPRRRGLGGPVADAAIHQAPRPLWLEPALPSLRERYRLRYGFLDASDSHWMYLP